MPRISHRIIPSAVRNAAPVIISWFNYFAPHKYEGTLERKHRGKQPKFGVFRGNHAYGCKLHKLGGRK